MKTVIGADGNLPTSQVSKRFGHAAYYIIYDHTAKTLEAVENIDEGHNHDNLKQFIEAGVDSFIVGNIGPHAFSILREGNAKIFLARKMNVDEAVNKLNSNELKELDEPTVRKSRGHSH